jgi:hypothetical protein
MYLSQTINFGVRKTKVTEISTEYRYHPESADMQTLCKQFEQQLPTARFSHKYVRENLTGRTLLMVEAWDKSHQRYYSQVLRDSQEPEDIAARFYESLKPRNPKPTIWLPNSAL